ncbi:MAG TPA: ferrous iron transport protein B, partial [Bacteroidales bacterium]|nr:ferrous iron transport protein B [Bacteroidales bacterium]
MSKENVISQTLASLQNGERGLIIRVNGEGAFRKRLTEMGFIRGKVVKVIKNAPLLDPIEYSIMGYEISLRRSEAEMIELLRVDDDFIAPETAFEGTYLDELATRIIKETGLKINVALVGNPNSGKTTLFNQASGRHERVGNYSGVTVDAKEARITKNSFKLKMVDLPGTYSLSEYTPEELYVRDHLIRKKPDVVINVIDASNLERNMFLTTQLIDMGLKVIIALNMYDELEHKGVKLDRDSLSKMLGIPIIPTIAIKGKGIQELIDKVIEVYKDEDPVVRTVNINFGQTIEKSIRKVKQVVEQDQLLASTYPPRYLAIKLLEEDHAIKELAEKSAKNKTEIAEVVKKEVEILEDEFSEISETILTDARYGFIAGALRETCSGYQEKALASNRNIDDLLTHKIWGFPVFIFFMWLMFQATFTLGSYPMEWIDMGVGSLASFVSAVLPDGPLHDLIVDGIIGGVGGVIIFLPNILILFFFISLMEDTGYMARVSFIMDRLMHKIGLHGKSFIPLLMGFGCNVPAVMATRTLENRNDRMIPSHGNRRGGFF